MKNNLIHPSAIIEDGAKIGNNVKIGPFSYVGSNVEIADEVELKSHVVVDGHTYIGQNTVIYPFASIGNHPQDLKYKGGKSLLWIGRNNVIREYVTIHPGNDEGKETIVGDNCLLMIGVHIAHDCNVGNNVIFANNATLAGHVIVEDNVVIGGLSAIHQFVRLGKNCMIGGATGIERDVPPFASASSDRAYIDGINLVGMKRRGFSKDEIISLQKAMRLIFSEENIFEENIKLAEKEYGQFESVKDVIRFMKSDSKRSFTTTRKK